MKFDVRVSVLVSAVVCASGSPVAHAAVGTEMVLDVNPLIVSRSSSPSDYVRAGDYVVFTTGPAERSAVWRSDGTAAGTVRIRPPDGKYYALTLDTIDGRALLQVMDAANNRFIWSTDGTGAGTQPLFQISDSSRSGEYAVLGVTASNRLLIWSEDPVSGWRIWSTDGTPAGTHSIPVGFRVASPYSGVHPRPVIIGDRIIFQAFTSAQGALEVWETDATLAGTHRIVDPDPDDGPSGEELLGGDDANIYYIADNVATGEEIWHYDAVTGVSQLLADVGPGAADGRIRWLAPVTGGVVFIADDTLCFSNSAGTLVTPLQTFSDYPEPLTQVGGRMLFTGRAPGDGLELWSTDGTIAGTVRVRDQSAGTADTSVSLAARLSDDRIIVRLNGGEPQLWSTDGTPAGTRQLTPSSSAVFGPDPVFLAFDPNATAELWKIDRVSEAVTRIPSPFAFGYFLAFGQQAFGTGSTPVTGNEPWITDGTIAGTHLLLDVEPQIGNDSGLVRNLTSVGGVAYFEASDGVHGSELWKTDGTTTGTGLVVDALPGGNGAGVVRPRAAGGSVYFQANYPAQSVWRSDGTSAGSMQVHDALATQFYFGADGNPLGCEQWLAPLGSTALFVAATAADGIQLWATDGSAAGTRLVNTAAHGALNVQDLCGLQAFGSLAYYVQTDNGRDRLFRSDGTSAGTFRLTGDSAATQLASVGERVAIGTRVFFLLADQSSRRLWSTDGTVAGTTPFTAAGDAAGLPLTTLVGALDGALIVERAAGGQQVVSRLDVTTGALTQLMTSTPFAAGGVETGGRLFFVCGGLCVTDGTAGGTSRIRQQDGSTGLPTVDRLLPYNGAVYFRSRPSDHTGLELWKSNGTTADTVRITPDAAGTEREITPPALAGGRVVFGMSDEATGRELWRVTSAPPLAIDDAVSLIAGNSVLLDVLANDADSDGRLVASGVAITANPAHGIVALQSNGAVRYTPNGAFVGMDTFKYRVSDDTGNASAEATVTVTVNPQPAPPPSGGGGGGGRLDWMLLGVLGALVIGRRRAAAR
jgi:ELWxxDGT repeat protein